MFKFSRDPAVSPELERETLLDLCFYLSISHLTVERLVALRSTVPEEEHKKSSALSLLLFFYSIQEQVTKLSSALFNTLNTPTASSCDEPPCRS